jgi:Peptidase family M28
MKLKILFIVALLGMFQIDTHGQVKINQLPVVDNLKVTVDTLKKKVNITYDLYDAENEPIDLTLYVSNDNGETYTLNTTNMSGDVGKSVQCGKGKSVVWNYSEPLTIDAVNIKIVADDLYKIDIQNLVAEVDSARLMKSLLALYGNRSPRSLDGMLGLAKARKYIESSFDEDKLNIEKQTFSVGQYDTYNVVGRKVGLVDDSKTYLLNAYFDTKEKVKGANWNGSGVAGLLEAARILSKYNFKKNIIFAGFDLKYQESTGCVKFVFEGGLKESETVEGAICLDGIGCYKSEPKSQFIPEGFEMLFPEQFDMMIKNKSIGNFVLNVSNDNSYSLMKAFEDNANKYVPRLKVISLILPKEGKLTPELAMSDHVAFWYGKLKAIDLSDTGYTRDMSLTYDDSIEKLNFGFMSNIVKSIIATMANLAEIQHANVAYAKAQVFLATR